MKFLISLFVFCSFFAPGFARADAYDQRAAADAARREAAGRAYAASQLEYAKQTVGALMARMAARHGGLQSWTPGIIGGSEVIMDPDSEMGFETNDGLACHCFMRNTDCNDLRCSNIELDGADCFDASGRHWDMDSRGGLKPLKY
jgi:hypothetical protein